MTKRQSRLIAAALWTFAGLYGAGVTCIPTMLASAYEATGVSAQPYDSYDYGMAVVEVLTAAKWDWNGPHGNGAPPDMLPDPPPGMSGEPQIIKLDDWRPHLIFRLIDAD